MNFKEFLTEKITDEMAQHFEKRTNKHIKLVQKYCQKIDDLKDERFSGIVGRGEKHDASKFKEPERDPYVYISWDYKCKADKVDYTPPEDIKEQMLKASNHHVLSNKHHPECHCTEKCDVINSEDRDKPPGKLIDATKMGNLDMAECVADWCAMSEELGKNTPQEWIKSNVNVRWKFKTEQVVILNKLADQIWN